MSLQDLLLEDQEPFFLQTYISDKRVQLRRPKTQLRKQRHLNFSGQNLCKNACFFSFHDSPDVGKSPMFELPSPVKRPSTNSSSVFLHIPARTAAVLLESASKIQKQSKNQSKSSNSGLFGSILKKMTRKNPTKKLEIGNGGVKVSVKDILRWDSPVGRRKLTGDEKRKELFVQFGDKRASEISASDLGLTSCSCNGRLSSAIWSECNEEEKSLDTETSSSGNSEEDREIISAFASEISETGFSKSPFRFVLQSNSSSDDRTQEFSSPATSPIHQHCTELKENHEEERVENSKIEDNAEDEKEQFSPVSVLDPPFENEVHEDEDDDDNDGSFDMECSYAFVERAKQQLLQKLQRFEQLADLDPIELEKRLLEDEQDEEEFENHIKDSLSFENRSKKADEIMVREILNTLGLKNMWRVSADLKKLVTDLISEEKREHQNGIIDYDRDSVIRRVCKRLDSLKEVESDTIDMMVAFDFNREIDGWKRSDQEQVRVTANEIEFAIFGLLVEELSEDLFCY